MNDWASVGVFLATSLAVLLLLVAFNRDDRRLAARLRGLGSRNDRPGDPQSLEPTGAQIAGHASSLQLKSWRL